MKLARILEKFQLLLKANLVRAKEAWESLGVRGTMTSDIITKNKEEKDMSATKTVVSILLFLVVSTKTVPAIAMLMTASEYAAYGFGKQIGRAANQAVQLGQIQNEFSAEINGARKAFWRCNNTCDEGKKLKEQFVSLLYQKDMYFLYNETYTQGQLFAIGSLTGTKALDGGIRPGCRQTFDAWKNAVASLYPPAELKADATGLYTSLLTGRGVSKTHLQKKYQKAIDSSMESYKTYVECRDRWEYDARPISGHPVDPQDFLWSTLKVNHHLKSRENGRDLVQKKYHPRYNKKNIDAIAQKLFEAPKKTPETARSWQVLQNPASIGCESANVYNCFHELLDQVVVRQRQHLNELELIPVDDIPEDFADSEKVKSAIKKIADTCRRLPEYSPGRDRCISYCERAWHRIAQAPLFEKKSAWGFCMSDQGVAFGLEPDWWKKGSQGMEVKPLLFASQPIAENVTRSGNKEFKKESIKSPPVFTANTSSTFQQQMMKTDIASVQKVPNPVPQQQKYWDREDNSGEASGVTVNMEKNPIYRALTNPPPGIRPIKLPFLHGVPALKSFERKKDTGITGKQMKKHLKNFVRYVDLAMLATDPAVFSFNAGEKEPVKLHWTDFLIEGEKKRFTVQLRGSKHQWQGADQFEQIDTASIFRKTYHPELSQWAEEVFTKPARMLLIYPTKLSRYDFEKQVYELRSLAGMRFRTQDARGNVFPHKEWEFNYKAPEYWHVDVKNAREASKVLTEKAKLLFQRKSGGSQVPSNPTELDAYHALTVQLHPKKEGMQKGYIEVLSDALYMDAQLTKKLTEFTVNNKRAAILGGVSEHERTMIVHPAELSIMLMKQHGLPSDRKAWVQLMKTRRNFERQYPDECGMPFFDSRYPYLGDTQQVPEGDIEKFKKWMMEKIDNLGEEITLELIRKGPSRDKITGDTTLLALFNYPKKASSLKRSRTPDVIKIEGLNSVYKTIFKGSRNRITGVKTPVSVDNFTFSVDPKVMQGAWKMTVGKRYPTEIRTRVKVTNTSGKMLTVLPIESRLLFQGKVLKTKLYDQKSIIQTEQAQKKRKQALKAKLESGQILPPKEMDELDRLLTTIEEKGWLHEARIKQGHRQLSESVKRIGDKRMKKSERKREAKRKILDAGREIVKSQYCSEWRETARGQDDMPKPVEEKSVSFAWNELESAKRLSRYTVDWGVKGKPQNTQIWYVLKADISLGDCHSYSNITISAKDYVPCKQKYCLEHDTYDDLFRQ